MNEIRTRRDGASRGLTHSSGDVATCHSDSSGPQQRGTWGTGGRGCETLRLKRQRQKCWVVVHRAVSAVSLISWV